MQTRFDQLVTELKGLRKGRGLFVGQIGERVGPALRELCGVVDNDGPAQIRHKLAERLEDLASGLPEDLRIALLAAFAIDRDARLPYYWDRVRWAADRIHRDERTARRRIDEGIDRIAELATSISPSARPLPAEASATGWHTEELKIILVLDQPAPEALEFRRIVAERDHITDVDLAMTLTANPDRVPGTDADQLQVDAIYGGVLVKKTLESRDRFGLLLSLPIELGRDARHEFALRYRVPSGQLQPHFVCVPKHRCDVFDLRIRFDVNRLPSQVWRLVGAFQRDVDDPTHAGEFLQPNAVGDVHARFHGLAPGRAYGIRWTAETSTGMQAH